jgi:Pvc16 N-terminal domain
MSDYLAIAAVTATLRNLLEAGIAGKPEMNDVKVTALPPDKAREGTTTNQVNLFLYQTAIDGAWRNQDVPGPGQVTSAGARRPPLGLVLHYLLTAFGSGNNDGVRAHRVLGRAMSILHDHALLGPQEIREALPDSDLAEQVERVRITLHPTSLDELSKLWTAFQTEYRLSVAYEASVVLLDSTLPATTPLPVLRRGTDDRGVIVVLGSLPRVDRLRMPGPEPTAELGDTLTIAGRNLTGDSVRVLLRHPLVERPFERRPLDGASAESLTVKLPDPGDPADDNSPAARWPAGFYTVTVVTTRTGEPDRRSNRVALALRPRLLGRAPTEVRTGEAVTLQVTCRERVRPEQRAVVLFGEREVPAVPVEVPPGAEPTPRRVLEFRFTAPPLPPDVDRAEHVVRLSVDGVHSSPLDRRARPPRFGADQKVTVTT